MKNLPLYQRIFEHYYEKIMNGQLKEGYKLHTDKEIMEIFYVSRITANAAVQMLVERGLVERFPGKGTFVTKNPKHKIIETETKVIGVILCDLDASFGLDLFKGIEKEAEERNIHLLFRRSFENVDLENKAINSMVDLGVSGIIIQMTHGETYSEEILKLHLNGLPFVLIDRHMDKTRVPFVTTDNKGSTARMTSFLMENDYKNIAFISASTDQTSTLNFRYEGFKSVYKSSKNYALLNLKTPEIRERNKELIQADRDLIKEHLLKFPEIDCVFAAEFFVAMLVKDVVEEMGKNIPNDIGIVCFDSDNSEAETPFFTHIRQNQTEMGRLAVKKIESIFTEDNKYSYSSLLMGEIVIGSSVKLKEKEKNEKI